MRGLLLGETTFALVGVLFLLAAVRAFTSTLYMSLFGNVANETVGVIALGVFAASLLAVVPAWRFGPRASVGVSGAALVMATLLATASRNNWLDIGLWAGALVAGTWWLALLHASRPPESGSPLVAALPLALAADLALRAAFRTVPVVDQPLALALPLVLAAALVFAAAGLAALGADRAWTSPGPRGALGLAGVPAVLLVSETGGMNAAQVAGAAGLGVGPEGPGSLYLVMVVLGLGVTAGAFALARERPAHRALAAAGIAAGALLLWADVPLVPALGGAALAAGLIVASAILPDTARRPARSPVQAVGALGIGWIAFVALVFVFYAYYAYAPAVWVAGGLVILTVAVSSPAAGRRVGPATLLLVAALAVLVPVVALVSTPSVAIVPAQRSFRLMTYNVHQGFNEGNVPALDEIADTIAREAPDVVVLQEVVRGWTITQQHDVLTVLAERLGMSYVFGPAIGDVYGNAVLSRFPLSDVRYVRFDREPALRHQPRGAIVLRVADVLLIATHLDHIAGASEVRQRQVRAMLAAWGGGSPALVAGDLNALPGSPEMELLRAAGFRDLAVDTGADQATFPATDPRRRIDYIWGIGVTGSQAHTVASTASDHRALVVNIAPQR